MSSDTEKLLSSAVKVFNAKLAERQVIKLEGMEDYLKVPQYKALVTLEKKASQLETDAVLRIMDSKIAYLKAANELKGCEKRYFEEIRSGMDSLEERNKLVKDVNIKMRKGDYSMLQPTTKPPIQKRAEAARGDPPKAKTSKEPKSDLMDIKKRLAMLDISMDTPSRPPLQPIHVNKTVEITTTPKSGPTLSSKGSLDGSLVPNRAAPSTPLSPSKWNVPAPNFDDTIGAEPINPLLSGPTSYRPLPSVLLHSPPEAEKDDADDTFPLNMPSLPFQTPTVPHSRPFLLSSMRKESRREEEEPPLTATRPAPTPQSLRGASSSADPLSNLGLMKMKRPVLNSEVGKKLMGQL